MRIQYDPEADVLLILFKELPPADAVEEEGGVILSYGEDGEPVSLELLHAAGRGLIDPEASHVTVQIKNVSMDEEFLRTSWEQQRTAGGPIGDLEEWKKLVPKAYQQLIKRAQTVPYDDMCIPYGKLGEMIGLRHLSEWFQLKIGWVVGACSEHGYQRSHPLISAMVVNADTNQPGKRLLGTFRDTS